MQEATFNRINKTLQGLSTDEADMFILGLVELSSAKYKEPFYQTAQKMATEFLKMRRETM
jgi:hypothetical protein